MPRRRAYLPLVVAVWAVAAFAFAQRRVPFDDEWFSITLLEQARGARFWQSLAQDVHPPWVALLDRWLFAVSPGFALHHAARVIASGAAFVALGRVLEKRARIPVWLVGAAAFHPVLLMYGGALRWYPFVLLAQALRAWALWSPDAPPRLRQAAFVGGAILGPAAGYVDWAFLGIDLGWLVAAAKRKEFPGAAATAIGAGAGAAALLIASPLGGVSPLAAGALGASFRASALLTWAGLGAVGEAHPPLPFAVGAVAALAAMAWGGAAIVKETGRFGAWFATTLAGWCASTAAGVWHPRYSLLVWFVLLVGVGVVVVRRGRIGLALGAIAYGYLAIVLVLTVRGTGFLKGDLNDLPPVVCDRIAAAAADADLVLAPYPRTAAQIDRQCRVRARVETVPWIRHFRGDEPLQLAPIAGAVRAARTIALVSVATNGSSLEDTMERVRGLLGSRCAVTAAEDLIEDPYFPWKRRFFQRATRYRYRVERWSCVPR